MKDMLKERRDRAVQLMLAWSELRHERERLKGRLAEAECAGARLVHDERRYVEVTEECERASYDAHMAAALVLSLLEAEDVESRRALRIADTVVDDLRCVS